MNNILGKKVKNIAYYCVDNIPILKLTFTDLTYIKFYHFLNFYSGKIEDLLDKTITEIYEEPDTYCLTVRFDNNIITKIPRIAFIKENFEYGTLDKIKVIIESPFANDNKFLHEVNINYAKAAMRDSISRGEAPLASHLLYTQVLDDSIEKERNQGIECGFVWNLKADLVAVYNDFGISNGMKKGIEFAKNNNIPVEYRKLYNYDY